MQQLASLLAQLQKQQQQLVPQLKTSYQQFKRNKLKQIADRILGMVYEMQLQQICIQKGLQLATPKP